jgi:hypothetical protein
MTRLLRPTNPPGSKSGSTNRKDDTGNRLRELVEDAQQQPAGVAAEPETIER